MIRSMTLCLALLLGCISIPAESRVRGGKKTMAGYVDEEAGSQYVLRERQELKLIALLQPVGFKNEHFAKYMGCIVEVTGSLAGSASDTPVLKVEKLKPVDERCKPKARGWRTEGDLQPKPQ